MMRVLATMLAFGLAGSAFAQESDWNLSIFAGQLTANHFEEVLKPGELEFVDSQLLGLAVGYDWPLRHERWSLGFEFQVVRHFGLQQHWEANLPLILRYHPKNPWPRALDSLAFGIGGSYATRIPVVEVNNDGASRHSLIYWMAEMEFATRRPGDSVYFRIHHRSDAFGLLEPEAGSNALVFGYRRSF